MVKTMLRGNTSRLQMHVAVAWLHAKNKLESNKYCDVLVSPRCVLIFLYLVYVHFSVDLSFDFDSELMFFP